MPRFYVSMTWEDWPEGGSFVGTTEAASDEEAVSKVMDAMALARTEGMDGELATPEYWLLEYGEDWELVDCFNIDEFIEEHRYG